MTLYEIEQAIIDCCSEVDEETGEIINLERLEALQMDKQEKVENVLLYYKNLNADADAIQYEIDKLKAREEAIRKNADRLKEYAIRFLNGDEFSTPRVKVSYRRTKSVEVSDGFVDWASQFGLDELLRFKAPEPDKRAIAEYLKTHSDCRVARIVEKTSMSIK